jgi:ribonuclease P protein component
VALPQRHRLRGQATFERIYRQASRLSGTWLVLRRLEARSALLPPADRRRNPSPWRCAVVVSTKVSKRAVQRNRLRRLLHHHLLACAPRTSTPQWLVISLKPGAAEAAEHQLLEECTHLMRQAALLP